MTTSSPSARPIFDPVDTSGEGYYSRDDVESPSLSSSNALARFEFEPGRSSKDGTKVLMVEWEDDEVTKEIEGDWEVSWDGKRTTLPARDPKTAPAAPAANSDDDSGEQPVNRLYFLLGPGVPVPTAVRLQRGSVIWRTNPLPAIFAPELGATARQAGKKGVLHTVWAKKRLQVLQNEIEHESMENSEGIALEMAVAEKNWIEENFGVFARPGNLTLPNLSQHSSSSSLGQLNSPASPRSPGGGRLMDKLKGLRIDTSEREVRSSGGGGGGGGGDHNPLSPESSDVAVSGYSGFAALKGDAPSAPFPSLTTNPPQQSVPQRRVVAAQPPPDAAKWQPQQGMGSLNAFASGDVGFSQQQPPPPSNPASGDDDDDDLFALPMSPRSPDMAKSPFSFTQQDTTKHSSLNG